jgi:hypothetical protein
VITRKNNRVRVPVPALSLDCHQTRATQRR